MYSSFLAIGLCWSGSCGGLAATKASGLADYTDGRRKHDAVSL
jgi:hypothetical protein